MTDVKFGTSGLRGLAIQLQGQTTRRYVAAFLTRLKALGQDGGGRVYIGQDFRQSSASIAADCAAAVVAAGLEPIDCGTLPTPALALHAMQAGCAAVMVTGSHIPADRNGLKFYLPGGEISKIDETRILAALVNENVPELDRPVAFDSGAATERYFSRFANLFPDKVLRGLRIGVFEHSTVARDLLTRILQHYGAETVSLGRSNCFVPIDTEAFGDEVFAPLNGWAQQYGLDAIVSADGDGDRPLLMDDEGQFVRGDVLGLITARYLCAHTVVTPVTSNSGIERTEAFAEVVRTKVGSPYVIAGMEERTGCVVGFEANGGTLIGDSVTVLGRELSPLPTRDAMLPLLCVLASAAAEGVPVGELVRGLPLQHAIADRLQHVSPERSSAFLAQLAEDKEYAEALFLPYGIAELSMVDGLQFRTTAGDMIHFRASGNAPELRVYVEASTLAEARALLDWGLGVASKEVA